MSAPTVSRPASENPESPAESTEWTPFPNWTINYPTTDVLCQPEPGFYAEMNVSSAWGFNRLCCISRADHDAIVDEVLNVTHGRGARGAGDRNVILGAQAALEALHPFAEDPGESFFLPLIELTLDPVVELRFLHREVDHALCRDARGSTE